MTCGISKHPGWKERAEHEALEAAFAGYGINRLLMFVVGYVGHTRGAQMEGISIMPVEIFFI